MGINNPFPSSFPSECKKVANILQKFTAAQGSKYVIERPIPPHVLQKAKGLAVITILKGGFIGSGRGGSGLLIARRPDGTWSAPSAIGTAGGGIGGQIGLEITDFVYVLNDEAAVRTLAEAGSITLGTNVSVAAGPVGRNAEAAGAASTKGVAGIFAYSDTKGLFAGVSIEGSAIIERSKENRKFYGRPVTARQLLSGEVPFPPEAESLRQVLSSPVFTATGLSDAGLSPHSPVSTGGIGGQQSGVSPAAAYAAPTAPANQQYAPPPPAPNQQYGAPARPTGPKPTFNAAPAPGPIPGADRAVATFTFEAQQPGDLSFKPGDYIIITKRTQSDVDWWSGKHETTGAEGSFPSNYVRLLT